MYQPMHAPVPEDVGGSGERVWWAPIINGFYLVLWKTKSCVSNSGSICRQLWKFVGKHGRALGIDIGWEDKILL